MTLCDTTVLVDVDRGGIDEKVTRLDRAGRHVVSAVTVTELEYGARLSHDPGSARYRDAMSKLDRMVRRFRLAPITREVASTAAEIIHGLEDDGNRLDDLHDVYVAATARVLDEPVLTSNVRHFDRIPRIEVVDWSAY